MKICKCNFLIAPADASPPTVILINGCTLWCIHVDIEAAIFHMVPCHFPRTRRGQSTLSRVVYHTLDCSHQKGGTKFLATWCQHFGHEVPTFWPRGAIFLATCGQHFGREVPSFWDLAVKVKNSFYVALGTI